MTRGNDLITSYSYYGVANGYRPQQITVGESGSPPLVEYGYSYDAIGQITTLTAEIAGDDDTQTFTYDTLGRLRTAAGSGDTAPSFGMTYEYDDLGNLVTIKDLSGTNTLVSYDMAPGQPQPHAVKARTEGMQTYEYGYDALGQMTMREAAGSGSVITYTQTFDALGRMTTITDGSDSTYFVYDANGVRVLTVDVEGNLIYTPFPDYEREVRSANTIRLWTFSLDGAAVATRVIGDPDTANNGLVYMHGDHLGSMTVISDDDGELKDSARYYPFGGRRVSPTHEITDSGYTSHKHNDDLGLIYMVARYYDPALRRFISADTIVPDMMDTGAYNRFAYVNNNPVNFNDPTGHVCYDPGLDAVMPGNCNGGSKPLPPPGPPQATQLWIDPEKVSAIQLYGNTNFAFNLDGTGASYAYSQGFHGGLDLLAEPGTEVVAGFHGTVAWVSDWSKAYEPRYVVIEIAPNTFVVIGHLSADEPSDLKAGDVVTPDTVVGTVSSEEGHAHIEFWMGAKETVPDEWIEVPYQYMSPKVLDQIEILIGNMYQYDTRITFYARTDGRWSSIFDQPRLNYGKDYPNLNVGQPGYVNPWEG